MSVEYDEANNRVIVTCLEGNCSLSDETLVSIVFLGNGQWSNIPGLGGVPTDPQVMPVEDVQAWIDAIQQSGIEVIFQVNPDAYQP